jgi:Cu2+-exporting ATPase
MKRDGCIHCGTPLRGRHAPEGFCCTGCEQVYQLIQQDGLEAFYVLQDQMGRPVNKGVKTEDSNNSSLRRAQQAGEATGDYGVARLRISGMTCLGCIWLIEQISRRFMGCRSARANLQDQVLDLTWEKGQFDLVELTTELNRFNYALAPLQGSGLRVSAMAWRALICGVLALNAFWLEQLLEQNFLDPSLAGLFHMLALSVVVLSLFVGAGFFVVPVFRALRIRLLHYDILAASAIVLLVLHLFSELTISSTRTVSWSLLPCVLFFLSGGRWLQQGFWQKLRDQSFRDAVICQRSAMRWRRSLMIQSSCIVLGCLVFVPVGLTAGNWMGVLKTVAGCLLIPAFYPLAAIAQYDWPRRWIYAGVLSTWLVLGFAFCLLWSPPIAASWSALSGFLWLFLFSTFGQSHGQESEQVS